MDVVVPPSVVTVGTTRLEVLDASRGGEVADAINANLEHLRPWMEWAQRPTTAHEQGMRLALADERRRVGGDATWMILDASEGTGGSVIGGCGLHHRDVPGVIDIGYWLGRDATARGHASRAAAALTRIAFEVLAASETRIVCDARNERSAAVARRLGYAHAASSDAEMIWRMRAADWASAAGNLVAADATWTT